MIKEFNELKKELIQSYIDNYDSTDSNEAVAEWIEDTYPDFDVIAQNEKMQAGYNADDVATNNIIIIKNENDLQNKLFYYDETTDNYNIADDPKLNYLAKYGITKNFNKYEVLTLSELFNYALGSFEKSDGFDFGEFFDYIDPNVIKEYKESGTAELLFNDFLEEDQGVYYNAEESFTDLDNDLYILKCTENVIM